MTYSRKLLISALAILSLAACTPVIDVRGNLVDTDMLKHIQVGVHNKDHVTELLGPPSSTLAMNKNVWVYMGQRTETVSFFDPVILEERILVLKFDDKDMLALMYEIDPKQGIKIIPNKRKTPTSGHDISFLHELFGSFGQFNRPSAAPAQKS